MRGSPFLRIHFERQMHEIRKLLAHLVFVFDGRRARRGNEPKCPERGLVKIGWLPFNHFDRHDAQTPNVDFTTIFFAHHDFRCHPIGRTDHGTALGMGIVDLCAETKIGFQLVSGVPFATVFLHLLSLMLPSMERRMLSDLISRWITPFECKC